MLYEVITGEFESMSINQTTLGPKFEEALLFANRIHAEQKRKDSGAPYLAHVLGVAALVLEDGGSEEEAIAALLHDAAEDQGGEEILAEIQGKFGEKVSQIVRECSDTLISVITSYSIHYTKLYDIWHYGNLVK